MKIDARAFRLMYWAAQTDDIKYPKLGHVEFLESHWCIDDHGCYYIVGEHEPEQPQWPPVIEPGWCELYGERAGFFQKNEWRMQ